MEPKYRNRIRELREEAGISQARLASKAGISDTTLQNYEYGTRDMPAKTVRRLAAIFGVTTDHLLCNDAVFVIGHPDGPNEQYCRDALGIDDRLGTIVHAYQTMDERSRCTLQDVAFSLLKTQSEWKEM